MRRRYVTRPLSVIVSAAALIVLVLPSGALAMPFSVSARGVGVFGAGESAEFISRCRPVATAGEFAAAVLFRSSTEA